MPAPVLRVTDTLLDVLEALVQAHPRGVYGYRIAVDNGRYSGSVHAVLMRLEGLQWVTGQVIPNPRHGRPPQRMCTLTAAAYPQAVRLLARRRRQ